ncbi:MAG: LamG-like jellyroll fold domain-containing protein, partial [Opitutaceae bacterium]
MEAVRRNGATFASGQVSQGFAFDGSNDFAEVAPHANLNLGTSTTGFSIELWVKPDEFRDTPLVQWANETSEGVSLRMWNNGRGLFAFIRDTNGQGHDIGFDNVFQTGVWQHIAVTYDRTTGFARLYRNGVILTQQSLGIFTPQTTYGLYFGALLRENRYFKGTLDELSLYRRALAPHELHAIYATGLIGKAPFAAGVVPTVNAGADFGAPALVASLSGSVNDDNQPLPLLLRWQKIAGPGNAVFGNPSALQTSATFDAPGIYVLELAADDGLHLVRDTVTVAAGVRYAVDTFANLAAWWPANSSPTEVVNGRHAQPVNGLAYASAQVATGFAFDGATAHAFVPAHPQLDLGTSPVGFSIEAWVKPAEFRDTPLVQWATSTTEGVSLRMWNNGRGLFAFIRDTNGQGHDIGFDNFFEIDAWHHLALTYDRTTGVARLYKNGLVVAQQNLGVFTPQTSYDLYFGALLRENRYFKGSLDELAFYTRPLTSPEITSLHQAGPIGKSPFDTNTPPLAHAGPDVVPNPAGVAALAGAVTDPTPTPTLTVAWSKLDGPGNVTFGNAAQAATTATFTAPGLYVLQLDADDGLNRAKPSTTVARVGVRYAFDDLPGLVAWWPFNANPIEVVRGNHDAQFVNGPAYSSGNVGMALSFDGVNDYSVVPAHADLNIGASTAGFSLELWVKPDEWRDVPLVQWATPTTEGLSLRMWNNGRGLFAFIRNASGGEQVIGADNQFQNGVWQHVGVTYDRVTGLGRVYKNGQIVAQQNLGVFTPQTTYDLYFGALVRENRLFKGALDEVTAYTRPLTPTEMLGLYQAGTAGKSPIDANTPPSVNAGPDVSIASTAATAQLRGSVTDDGLPHPLTIAWSQVDGPGTVAFANPASPQTGATFSTAGLYLLKLAADDGLNQATPDYVLARVALPANLPPAAGLAAWWPGNATPAEIIHSHDAELMQGTTFGSGSVSMAYTFNGAGNHAFVTGHPDLNVGASATGFTIELWAKPDEFRDVSLVQWATQNTEGASLRMWNNGRGLFAFIRDTAGVDHIFGADNQFQTGVWQHVAVAYDKAAGIGRIFRNGALVAQQNIGVFTAQTTYDLYFGALVRESRYFKGGLDEISLYDRPLSEAEIAAIFAAGPAGKTPTPANQPPTVNAGSDTIAFLDTPANLAGTALDDGLPTPPASLTYAWSKVSGPGNVIFSAATAATTTASFSAAGSYTLRLTASDSLLSGSDDIGVSVQVRPVVALTAPANNSTFLVNTSFTMSATASVSGGTIALVEFFRGTTKLGEDSTAPYSFAVTGGLAADAYQLTARATDNFGVSATSAVVNISVVADSGAPYAELFTPAADARLTAPTAITGVAASPILASWKTEYRLKSAEGAPGEAWVTFASGTTAVGTLPAGSNPAVSGPLGTFDPTQLLNGIYEVRLSATDTLGTTAIDGPVTFVVEGNMKVGAFTLAFEDLKVPVAGIPITVTRTYDSRDARAGDFGPGWRLALNNIRTQKNRNLGAGWFQNERPPGNMDPFFFHFVEPLRERIVTVAMPDGETHRFRGGALVKSRIGDPDNASLAVPATRGKYRFYPLGDTTSKLEPLNGSNQLAEDFFINGVGNIDLVTESGNPESPIFNTTRFRLTTSEGTVFILDEALGLLEMRDLSGNTLALVRDAQNRVTGVTSTQNAPGGPIVRTVTIARDATGRVDYIRDPAGRDLDYIYDAQGRLASFTNRELNVTQFRYENASFPNYLTKIIDPRGVTALRSEFDPSGKLVKQIDADGKETIFNRGIDATGRFEKVKDRLGNETTFYYDDRGNVTLKIDPLGAQTTFSYWPDSDRVKFETDHYGNAKSMAYDERGNVTVQTIGASLAENPAAPTTGHITRTTYNAQSAPTQIVDPDGRVQTFGYHATTNNLLTHTLGAGGTAPATTIYTYKSDGTLDTITDALGNVTSHTYDYAFSNGAYPGAVKQITVTVTDPAGAAGSDPANATATVLRATRTLSDAQENQLAQIVTRTLPNSTSEDVVTRYLYDTENRLVATVLADGRVTETRYTSFGKEDKSVLWKSLPDYQAHSDANARITSFAYDARGNQTAVTYADGTSESMSFDFENRKAWSQDRRGYRTFFAYDALGRLRFTIHPDANDSSGTGVPPVSSADPRLADNPRTETVYDLAGRVTDTYDELRRRTQTVYFADGTPDASRRRQMVQVRSIGNLVTTYAYDRAGNVRFVTDPRGNTMETRYDDHGRPTRVIHPATDEHPATEMTTSYDLLGRRVATTDQEGKITRHRYDALGRLVEVRQYLNAATAASDTAFQISNSDSQIVSTRYTYDELDAQIAQTDALGRTTAYESDRLGRRTKRTLPKDTAEAGFLTETLQYDEWGNLWKRTDFAGKTTTFGYDALNRLKSKLADATHPSLGYSHAIARIEFDYDANGARTAARAFNAGSIALHTETTPRDERGRIDYKDTAGGRLDYSYHANNLL